jgi:general secretion pathway protein H
MPTSAPGSSARRSSGAGFTLLELLLVVAIIAIAAGGVGLALRDSEAHQLERDAERLAALLESARSQSRATGVPVRWLGSAEGFRFEGLDGEPPGLQPWKLAGLVVQSPRTVLLGPEPILEPVTIQLSAPGHSLRVSTDGLRPFAVRTEASDAEGLR